MIVDAVIVLIAALIALGVRSRASFALLSCHALIFILVHLWWENSSFWNVSFLADYHLYQAFINVLVLVYLWRMSKESYETILATSVLVIVSSILFYNRTLYLDGLISKELYLAILGSYPFVRLVAVSLQLAGLLIDDNRDVGRLRKLFSRINTFVNSIRFNHLLLAKIYK